MKQNIKFLFNKIGIVLLELGKSKGIGLFTIVAFVGFLKTFEITFYSVEKMFNKGIWDDYGIIPFAICCWYFFSIIFYDIKVHVDRWCENGSSNKE